MQQWSAHRSAYKPPAVALSPAEILEYWERARTLAPELSRVARFRRVRSDGNAASERNMSIVSHMDQPTRRCMEPPTLYNLSMLRGNSSIVHLVSDQMALELDQPGESRRKRAREESEKSNIVNSLTLLLSSLHAKAKARSRSEVMGEEEEEEEGEEGEEEEEEGGEGEAGDFSPGEAELSD